MSEWQPIETAPKDSIIFACDAERGYSSKVTSSGPEWECVDHRGYPMGVGFYPTHWKPLKPLPKPPDTKPA